MLTHKVSGFLNLKINLLYHVYDRFMGGYVVMTKTLTGYGLLVYVKLS